MTGAVFFMPYNGPMRFRWVYAAAPFVLALALSPALLAQSAPPTKPPQAEICDACHGPNGNAVIPQNPSLAGQNWRYIYIELKDFKEGRRQDPQMTPVVAG